MNKNKSKVIVLGLDGATFRNLKPWMEQGLLPNLKFLVDNGASGELESTIPRLSSPAWTSFMTGVNPGKHGVFGFIKPFRDKRYRKDLVTSKDIKAKTIFEILSEYGKTSGVINLPMTYPPFQINGFMISCGLTTPSVDFNFTYPEDLLEKIGFKKSDYILDVNPKDYMENEKERFFLALANCTEKRKEISFKLMNIYDWDLFAVIFTETDRLQHFFWNYIDSSHSKYNSLEAEKFLPFIVRYYQKLDSVIGEFINYIDDNTSLLIMSDHGFGPLDKKIAFHKILEENGLLHYKKESFLDKVVKIQSRIRGVIHRNFLMYKKIKEIIKPIYYQSRKRILKKEISQENVEKRLGAFHSNYWRKIDWQKTVAYKCFAEDSVYLNLKGREPEGIINLITNLYDQELKRKLKVQIYKNEEIYNGTYSQFAPDIYFEIEDARYEISTGANLKSIIEENVSPQMGKHTRDGILICYGKNFKISHFIKDAQIIDLAPTILYLLSAKIPEHMDGKVLQDVFKDELVEYNPIYFDKIDGERILKPARKEVYSNREMEQVKEHLTDLGYL